MKISKEATGSHTAKTGLTRAYLRACRALFAIQ